MRYVEETTPQEIINTFMTVFDSIRSKSDLFVKIEEVFCGIDNSNVVGLGIEVNEDIVTINFLRSNARFKREDKITHFNYWTGYQGFFTVKKPSELIVDVDDYVVPINHPVVENFILRLHMLAL